MNVLVLTLLIAEPRLNTATFYDGPAGAEDKCTGMVITDEGVACLAGYSLGKGTDFDFALVTIDTAGEVRSVHRYGAPLGSEDRPWSLALDSAGAVAAAGGSVEDWAQGWDYLLVKYGSGETVWVRRTDFPSHADDKALAVSAGPGNQLCLTGRTRKRLTADGERPVAERRSLGGPRNDKKRTADWDVGTVLFNAAGETIWTRRFDGPAQMDDHGTAVAFDALGNVYVTASATVSPPGTDILLLKYGRDGALLWQRVLAGSAKGSDMAKGVLVDQADGERPRCYVFGSVYNNGSSFDFLAARFDTAGKLVWSRTLDGSGSVDIAEAACLDREGNLVVTGHSTGRGTSLDILTVEYSPEGDTVWTRRYNGPRGSEDRGYCVTIGRAGEVYVGGTSIGSNGFPQLVLLCYSKVGELLWSFDYSGGGPGETRPVAISLDPRPHASRIGSLDPVRIDSTRLLVAGFANRPKTGFDFFLLQLRTGD